MEVTVTEHVKGGQEADAPSLRFRVLLVEDNPKDARLFQLMLAHASGELFQIEWVDSLDAGLERAARGGIDIIISDLSLPDCHGFETFSRLHAQVPQVPIIVLSGSHDTAMAINAVHEGAQDFLVKGQVNGDMLSRAIRYAIERKRMTEQLHRYADELRKKNAQLEADFNMAREIQQVFLPHEYPSFPAAVPLRESALRFSHRYIPAAAVSGDFFDFFAVNDAIAGVFICDVMGHGMRAALITAIMRGLIEELMPAAAEPGRFLTEINRSLRAILRQTREPFMATAFYCVADLERGELRFANAGHPSPYLMRRTPGSVEPLKHYDPRHGPALGVFERAAFPTCRVPLETGDRVVMYTDGIYEVTDFRDEEFGPERLLAYMRENQQMPIDQLFDTLLIRSQNFSANREFNDDVCLVGFEVLRRLRGE